MSFAPRDPEALASLIDQRARERLLALARASVAEAVSGESIDETLYAECPDADVYGAFVTLRRAGSLRGCIGRLGRPASARELVRESARASALDDPRFSPVRDDELEALGVEISLLTPLEPLDRATAPETIVVGRDGLVAERGHHRGLLLPQVASELGWSAQTFLDQVCRKAGLEEGAWRDPRTALSRFACLVIPNDSGASRGSPRVGPS